MSANTSAFEPGSPAQQLVKAIRHQHADRPFDTAIILGSGWSGLYPGDELLGRYPYSDWNCFPAATVQGHAGHFDLVRCGDRHLLVFNGRFHCYQGLSAFEVSFPVRLAAALGCRRLLLTCAAGGIRANLQPGDYLLVTDHINLLGDNPLRGLEAPAFLDLGQLYQHHFAERLICRCRELGIGLQTGTLAAMPGPSYETPAEIRMLAKLGADIVSMSIVPEAVMARFLDLPVTALALVANPAAGLGAARLEHADVLTTGERARQNSRLLLETVLSLWR